MSRSRLCFAEDVVCSDAFLELSKPARALYLHLSMRCDSNGIIVSMRKNLRECFGNDAELDELVNSGFILLAKYPTKEHEEEQAYIVTDWWLNNLRSRMTNVPPCKLLKDGIIAFEGEIYNSRYQVIQSSNSNESHMMTTCIPHDDNMLSQEREYKREQEYELQQEPEPKYEQEWELNFNAELNGSAMQQNHPSLEEITEYVNTYNLDVIPENFYNYMEGVGWIGADLQPIRNWKAVIVAWSKSEYAPEDRLHLNELRAQGY